MPSQAFFLNFVPDLSYVESVVTNETYAHFFADQMQENKRVSLALVYHSISREVLFDPRYVEFMARFPKDTLHVIDAKGLNNEVVLKQKSYRLQHNYAVACPPFFPLREP